MSDDQLRDYVISRVSEISDRFNVQGEENPELIVIENISKDVPCEGNCREVWLVYGGDDDYDILRIYACGGSGAVYEFGGDSGRACVNP